MASGFNERIDVKASEQIRELLYPFWSYALVLDGVHKVRHLGLLDQIELTVTGNGSSGQVFHAAYESKPAGRIACIDFLARVDRQSRAMSDVDGLRPRLRALSIELGMTPNSRVRSWWVTAQVLTQHDVPSTALNAVCPSCDRFVTLHVRLNPNVAVCAGCGDTWTDVRFYELGEWVRWEGEHPERRAAEKRATIALIGTAVPRDHHG